MKIIISVFYLLFISNIAFAETSLDFSDEKLEVMDVSYNCEDKRKNITFKKINDKIFNYNYWLDIKKTGTPDSTVKEFNKILKGEKVKIYMFFSPIPKGANLGNGVILKILFQSKIKNLDNQLMTYWVKNDDAKLKNEMLNEWEKIFAEGSDDLFDSAINDWSEKAYKIVSKELEFGKPFEIVDLETIRKEGVHKKGKSHIWFQKKCKKL